MITGKTDRGFEFEIDEEILDDYEFLEAICEIDKGDVSIIPDAARMLLGDEQLKRLKESARNEKGKISTKVMVDEIRQILTSNSKGKN